MKRFALIAVVLVIAGLLPRLAVRAAEPQAAESRGVRIGSKKFTESVILGEILRQLIDDAGNRVTHMAELGGTQIVFEALKRGEVDAYPEYTGTLREEIYAGRDASTNDKLEELLKADGIAMSDSLGFSNNYAIAVRKDVAEKLSLTKISDLAGRPELRLGLSNEFLDRGDGWANLKREYKLPQDPQGMDHDLAYRYLEAGSIDATDVYTTDARLAELDLVLLKDDRSYFPRYDAVILSRIDLASRHPKAAEQVERMAGVIGQERMVALNAEVESRKKNEAQAAADFVRERWDIAATVTEHSVARQIWQSTLEHLDLVVRSLIPAILVALPLGVLAAKTPWLGRIVLGAAGVVQTIPALALLVLLIPPVAYLGLDTLGAGSATAIIALFLYSLLPIVQSTVAGLTGIAPEYRESAEALGLSSWFRLRRIELPLATPSILAGIKTAAVMNVGFATLGALVGARGYGQPILTGIRVNDTGLILQGAIPAACLAIVIQLGFDLAERWIVSPGLRVDPQRSNV